MPHPFETAIRGRRGGPLDPEGEAREQHERRARGVEHRPVREGQQPERAVREAELHALQQPHGLEISKMCNICKILPNFANFWRARSRLYQNEILQENMRLTAFFKLYKICILLHRCNLNILAKYRFEKSVIVVKIQQNDEKNENVAKSAKFCQFSKISAR